MSEPAVAEHGVEKRVLPVDAACAGQGLLSLAHNHFSGHVLALGRKLLERLDVAATKTSPALHRTGEIKRLDAKLSDDACVDGLEAMFDSGDEGAEHDVMAVHAVFRFESTLADASARRTRHVVSLFIEDIVKDERLELFTFAADGQGADERDGHGMEDSTRAIDETLGTELEALNVAETAKIFAGISAARAQRAQQTAELAARATARQARQ